MFVGDIKINSFTIGSLNVNDPSSISLIGFNIYENILNPLGPVGEARLNDFNDIVGKLNINGKEEVNINFSLDQMSNEQLSFKFKLLKNTNGNDGSQESKGSLHSKQSDFRFVTQELLNSQGNYISKSYETQTSEMLKDILKTYVKTDKEIDIQEATKGNRRLVFHNEHFAESYAKLNHEHVSSDHESSCYVCFMQSSNGNQKYVFTTFEKLFEQSPVIKLTQTNTLSSGNATETDKQNSILWFKPSDTFFTATRSLSKPNENTYNLVTGKVHNVNPKEPPKYSLADKQGTFTNPPNDIQGVPTTTIHDPANNKEDTYVADAQKKRMAFLSYLAENSAELEIPGNPSIKLGSMIELNIPKKANQDNEQGETQINGKALVVSIRHKIKPVGQSPRYTMVLRVVKGSYKEGGGGNG